MPNEKLIQQVLLATEQLAQESISGEVEGKAVAERLGIDPEGADLHYAFKVAEERGQIRVGGWEGSMGLPYMIKAA